VFFPVFPLFFPFPFCPSLEDLRGSTKPTWASKKFGLILVEAATPLYLFFFFPIPLSLFGCLEREVTPFGPSPPEPPFFYFFQKKKNKKKNSFVGCGFSISSPLGASCFSFQQRGLNTNQVFLRPGPGFPFQLIPVSFGLSSTPQHSSSFLASKREPPSGGRVCVFFSTQNPGAKLFFPVTKPPAPLSRDV